MKYFDQLTQEEQLHCRRVAAVSRLMAEALGLSPLETDAVEHSALFHDVGKAAVPRSLRRKDGELSREEWSIVLSHTTVGKQMLDGTESFLSTAPVVALQHHEYLDGSGYFGMSGPAIHPHARLVAAADVFDKLAFCREGQGQRKAEYACGALLQIAGTKLDEKMVLALMSRLERVLAACSAVNENAYSPVNTHC